jgi:hypothetical protein
MGLYDDAVLDDAMQEADRALDFFSDWDYDLDPGPPEDWFDENIDGD